eukprot:13730288-Alexandrium_andersonii.AAC.1
MGPPAEPPPDQHSIMRESTPTERLWDAASQHPKVAARRHLRPLYSTHWEAVVSGVPSSFCEMAPPLPTGRVGQMCRGRRSDLTRVALC